jgi:hypothetical protein
MRPGGRGLWGIVVSTYGREGAKRLVFPEHDFGTESLKRSGNGSDRERPVVKQE